MVPLADLERSASSFGFFGVDYWLLTIHVFALSIVTLVLTLAAGETRVYWIIR